MILVNGQAASTISATDRGLAYGDGVFRTFAARSGRALHWKRQYAKLTRDCAALALGIPEAETLEREVKIACTASPDRTVKIIVTRGEARRGYAYAGERAETRIVIADEPPRYPHAHSESGVRVRLCTLRLAHQPALAGVKHLNRLENVLARAEWDDDEIAEGILCDAHGNVIGGTMTNVFMVADGALKTPRLDRCGVAGVTRERVIEAAAKEGLVCDVGTFSSNELLAADEVFVVNSLAGIWPVRVLDGHTRIPGPLTRRLQRALKQEDDAQAA